VIPGGYAPDHLRRYPVIIDFVRQVYEQDGVIAFICHGGWVAISADILRGKRTTSFFAIKDDMINAGAIWEDSPVVRDGKLISSRTPDDLPAFCRSLIEALQ
jgi:protease I